MIAYSALRPPVYPTNMARILDGARIRDQILAELKPRLDALIATGRQPGLAAVVLAGHNRASDTTPWATWRGNMEIR